jgi:5,10-methylene-tetrahydrofolate dehydrogenase/methenyl tetrahydrofolate cyclohydrolase
MAMPDKLIAGRDIAKTLTDELSVAATHLQQAYGVTPQIAIIAVGQRHYGNLLLPFRDSTEGPTSLEEVHVDLSDFPQLKCAMAERCGLRSRLLRFSSNVRQAELLDVIAQLMADDNVHGIQIELPLPPHLDEIAMMNAVGASKDVDGFTSENVGLLALKHVDPLAAPSVAMAVLELLLHSRVPLAGTDAVVLGRSNGVGLPIAMMLQSHDCTVTTCHTSTRNIEEKVRRADLVIACVGKPNFVKGSWLKKGAVVIDVGMNAVAGPDGTPVIVGDVCYEEAKAVTQAVTPVPGGVGHVSFAVLLRNVINLARNSLGLNRIGTSPTLDIQSWSTRHASADKLHFPDLGLRVPQLLLPKRGIDLTKWCIIACDQYTSQPQYWKEIRDMVGDSPSTLHLIFPEVYLGQGRDEQIIRGIRDAMYEYDRAGNLQKQHPGFVLIDRKTPVVQSRKGLLVELDLEMYSFEKGSQSLIRPTEATIESRLPPRMAIRRHASVELPHILVLIDDPERTVIEPLVAERDSGNLTQLYDFELMKECGHLLGHHVTSESLIQRTVTALRQLADKEHFQKAYNAGPEKGVCLFPVGDGNHSLATAKRCWEEWKRKGADDDHPARFVLVELNNIHDHGLEFEPIHRLLFKANFEDMRSDFEAYCKRQGWELTKQVDKTLPPGVGGRDVHEFEFMAKQGGVVKSQLYSVRGSGATLSHGTLTPWLDAYLQSHKETEVDYVHGLDVIKEECGKDERTVGIILAAMNKNDLAKTVVHDGVLPRKTFSMGEADEKRFYFESRRIVPETRFFEAEFFRRGDVTTALARSAK